MTQTKASGGWRIVALWAAGLTAMVAAILAIAGTGEAGLHLVIRSTAQTSFGLFMAAFCASSLYRFWRRPGTRWLLVNRRYVGVSFGVSHALHLGAIVALAVESAEFRASVNPVTLIGGGLAYLFVIAMVATSSDAAVRRMGRRAWGRLHTVGGYYIWAIFFQSLAGRAVANPRYMPVAIVCAAAVVLRLAAGLASRRSTARSLRPSEPVVGAGPD